eukprot:1565883-Amphidinium_carterae.1
MLESVAASSSTISPSWLWSSSSPPSVTSSTPSSLSDNVAQEGQVSCFMQYYQSVYYYGYYGDYSCSDPSMCVCNARPTTHNALVQRLTSVSFLALVWCISFAAMFLVRHLSFGTVSWNMCGALRAVATGARADFKDVYLAM